MGMEFGSNNPQSQTKVPPPPMQEVSVRTMQSDIRAIAQGEITPAPEVITPGKAVAEMPTEDTTPVEVAPVKSKKSGSWILILFIVIGAIVAGLVGYYLAA